MTPSREDALSLLKKYNENESLVKHGLAVESAMRQFAKKFGEDEEKWGIVGLLHDLDYGMYPDEHCYKAKEIMEENGYPEEYIRAMMSHAYGICTDVEPLSLMEKTLYAVDELTGLVTACVYVRPSKSILDLTTKSVKKKWKQKSFAAGVDRQTIEKGAGMINMELNELISEVIEGMKKDAEVLGLKGSL
jgi:putative nucleotidyltransferase with HDIG domain